MYSQEFDGPWPAVLLEIQEFASLTHLSLGRGRRGSMRVNLSKLRVPATALQPHVGAFREAVQRALPGLQLTMDASDAPAHRVDITYGS